MAASQKVIAEARLAFPEARPEPGDGDQIGEDDRQIQEAHGMAHFITARIVPAPNNAKKMPALRAVRSVMILIRNSVAVNLLVGQVGILRADS
jgi:hypothetical protein